jgi:hypothetical protein
MSHRTRTASLLKASRESEAKLRAEVPKSPDWVKAQRDLVQSRADYWVQMREAWDWDHPGRSDTTTAPSGRPTPRRPR